ncbi:HAD-like domain-containing protein [Paraphysoderma sedebokerense]|nr:HAD-like domain-containing protein [Paraphysoderma sedebokerense]
MTSAPIYIFSDFDGTISTQDTGVVLIDKCMGSVRRKELDKQIFDGVISFREAITQMWDSVNMTWEEGQELLKDVVLDPYFEQFFMYCSAQDIPLFVLSR